jgi:dipeptidyl aminopeptidase/acylaminoacyl peptidase
MSGFFTPRSSGADPMSRTSSSSRRRSIASVVAVLSALVAPAAAAQEVAQQATLKELLATESYVRPPAAIEKVVTAPWHLNVTLSNQSPDRTHFLKLQSEGMPSVQQYGKLHYYLGGLQVDPKGNRARTLTTRSAAGLELVDAVTGQSRTIETPRGAGVSAARWSPDGKAIAYLAHFDDATHVYVADVATGRSRRLTKTPVLATLVTDLSWANGGSALVTVLLPENRGAEPTHPTIETGPQVKIVGGSKNRTRTYRDYSMLQDVHDKERLEYFTTGQLALLDVKTGAVKKLGAPAMISGIDPSPDGQYFRVTTMQKPFSYLVQYQNFGSAEQVWDANGKVVAELSRRALRDGDNALGDDPAGGPAAGDTARRNFGWLPNGKGLYFQQQEPAPARADTAAADEPAGGRGGRGGPARHDRLYVWEAPFTAGGAKSSRAPTASATSSGPRTRSSSSPPRTRTGRATSTPRTLASRGSATPSRGSVG